MRFLYILTIIILLSCNEEKKYSKKYLPIYVKLDEHNTKTSVFKGTPTFDKLKNNPNIKIEYFNSKVFEKLNIDELMSFDSSSVTISDSTIIISKFGTQEGFGELVTYEKTDNKIIISTLIIEEADLETFEKENILSVLDCPCIRFEEKRITLKTNISDRKKAIYINNAILKK